MLVEKGEEASLSEVVLGNGTYLIDAENSRLEWIGRNLNNRHFGRIDILKGELVIVEGRPSAGNIVPQQDGSIKIHAAFDIDRTLWNVSYGSTQAFRASRHASGA